MRSTIWIAFIFGAWSSVAAAQSQAGDRATVEPFAVCDVRQSHNQTDKKQKYPRKPMVAATLAAAARRVDQSP